MTVACPSGGPLADAVDRAGVERLPAPRRGREPAPAPGPDPGRARASSRAAGLALARASRRVARRRDPRQHAAHRAHGARIAPAAGRRAVRGARARAPARHARRPRGARAARPQRRGDRGRLRLHGRAVQRGPAPARGASASTTASTTPASTRPRVAGAACARSWDSRPAPGCSGRWPRSRPGRARTRRSGCSPSCAARASTPTWCWSARSPSAASGVRYDNHAFLRSLERLVDELGRARRGALPRPARGRARDHARAGPVAAALVGGALRPGDGGEHGDGHAAARDLGGRRPRAGRGRRVRPRAAAPGARGLGRGGAASCSTTAGALARMGERGPAGRGALPRRRARRRDARDLRARGRAAGGPPRMSHVPPAEPARNRMEAPWRS